MIFFLKMYNSIVYLLISSLWWSVSIYGVQVKPLTAAYIHVRAKLNIQKKGGAEYKENAIL